MKLRHLIFGLCFALSSFPTLGLADALPVQLGWKSAFSPTTVSGLDHYPVSVTQDTAGNTYLLSHPKFPAGEADGFYLTKFDPYGTKIWSTLKRGLPMTLYGLKLDTLGRLVVNYSERMSPTVSRWNLEVRSATSGITQQFRSDPISGGTFETIGLHTDGGYILIVARDGTVSGAPATRNLAFFPNLNIASATTDLEIDPQEAKFNGQGDRFVTGIARNKPQGSSLFAAYNYLGSRFNKLAGYASKDPATNTTTTYRFSASANVFDTNYYVATTRSVQVGSGAPSYLSWLRGFSGPTNLFTTKAFYGAVSEVRQNGSANVLVGGSSTVGGDISFIRRYNEGVFSYNVPSTARDFLAINTNGMLRSSAIAGNWMIDQFNDLGSIQGFHYQAAVNPGSPMIGGIFDDARSSWVMLGAQKSLAGFVTPQIVCLRGGIRFSQVDAPAKCASGVPFSCRIRSNGVTTSALTIALSSTTPGTTLPATCTIPPGESFVDVMVTPPVVKAASTVGIIGKGNGVIRSDLVTNLP